MGSNRRPKRATTLESEHKSAHFNVGDALPSSWKHLSGGDQEESGPIVPVS